jgi:upstream activation factor subunit UAF30
MAPNLDSLEPKVLRILKAPGTDLSTISAKRVRRQLLELDSTLTPEFLKENKEEVDAIISRVFEQVNSGDNGADEAESSDSGSRKKRKGGDDDDEDGEEEEERKRPTKKAKAVKNGKPSSDEVLARKLSSELNGRPSRAGAKSSTKARSTKKSAKKSAATIDSGGEGGSESGSEKKPKRSGGGGGGFKKEFVLRCASYALVAIYSLTDRFVTASLSQRLSKSINFQDPK